jgi:hypothetical protein
MYVVLFPLLLLITNNLITNNPSIAVSLTLPSNSVMGGRMPVRWAMIHQRYMVLVMPTCGLTVIWRCRAPDWSFHCMIFASEGHHIFQLRGGGATEFRHSRKICIGGTKGQTTAEQAAWVNSLAYTAVAAATAATAATAAAAADNVMLDTVHQHRSRLCWHIAMHS